MSGFLDTSFAFLTFALRIRLAWTISGLEAAVSVVAEVLAVVESLRADPELGNHPEPDKRLTSILTPISVDVEFSTVIGQASREDCTLGRPQREMPWAPPKPNLEDFGGVLWRLLLL